MEGRTRGRRVDEPYAGYTETKHTPTVASSFEALSQRTMCGWGMREMMARSATPKLNRVAGGAGGRRGFTLIEVLVVLAILVILFAMLFAPMIASLDMVNVGQSKVTMQNAARNALKEMRREISNAMYVYPVPGLTLKGADGLLGTADDVRIPNPSEIVFVGPARTDTGELIEPLAPRTDASGQIVATRLRAAPLDATRPYGRTNPFVLVREEGYYERQEDAQQVWWEFTNINATNPVRNILSPREGYDIPVSRSICLAPGCTNHVHEGYITECPDCAGSDIIYIHDNVRFFPERIIGETLQPTANHTLYQARYAAWAGFYNRGNLELNDLLPASASDPLMDLGASELDPRIIMLNPTDWSVVRDSWDGTDLSNTILTWDSNRGVVQVGATTGRWVNVTNPNDPITPGQYYDLQIQNERPDQAATTVDQYDENGVLAAGRAWDLVPVYPTLGPLICTGCGATYDPTTYNVGDPCPDASCGGTLVSTAQPGDPATPIAYRIDPTVAGAWAPAKIVPESVRVVVWGTDASGNVYQTAYSETSNINQSEIGPEQFAVVLSNYGQRAEVRFNELNPPSPRALTDAGITVQNFGIYIQYYYRRNYDPAAPENDYIIRADYSTQEIMNLRLALQRYIEPEADPANPDALIIPPDATPDRVSLEDQVQVRNLGR